MSWTQTTATTDDPPMTVSFENYLNSAQQRVQRCLSEQLGNFQSPFVADRQNSAACLKPLSEAMRYSLLGDGKRVRPMLVYAAAQAIEASDTPAENLDKAACAVEMIHAYSLIHDDLPAMDDDELRRGRATCHIAFDEATAILAGDALQTRAFELLCELDDCPPERCLRAIKLLAQASGQCGMVGGQMMDIAATDQAISIAHLESIHRLKTGALIRAAVAIGGVLAGAKDQQLAALDNYAEAIGLAFQVQDDILDIEGNTDELGKTQGSDQALNKSTYPSLLNLEGAKQKAQQLNRQAHAALQDFGTSALPLGQLADYIINRRR